MLAVTCALQCVVETGDNIVVIVSPIWPNIFQAAQDRGRRARAGAAGRGLDSTGKWKLDLEKLFAACDARTKAIFIASPGNPTGWMMTRGRSRKRCWISRATRGIAIISDEVYGTLVYDGTRACAVVSVTSPSRTTRCS